MLLLLYRGYTHLSAPLWLTTQNIFSTRLWCVWESVCVCMWEIVWRMNVDPPGTFSLNALLYFFFQDSIREYRWNYYDWEIHLFLFWWSVTRPDLCLVGLIVQPVKSCQYGIHLFYGCKKCLLCFVCFFFRDSLWSVNTESQIAINVLYTPVFLCW